MSTLFDLTTQSIETIKISRYSNGTNCEIVDKVEETITYGGFILRNGPQAQTICNVTFYPSSTSGKYIPRLEFKVVHTASGEAKVAKKDVRIAFAQKEDGCEEFWRMIYFLSSFKEVVDVGNFQEAFQVVDSDAYIAQFGSKTEARQAEEIGMLIKSGVSEETIRKALTERREPTLNQFEALLNDTLGILAYRSANSIAEPGDESVWHHFLKNNPWILGLGIDVRFIRDLIAQANVGSQDTTGAGSPRTDFLGIRDYTLLIELKTSETKIFTDSRRATSRANTWSFSNDFIDGVSQCLGQKSGWDKTQGGRPLVDPDSGEVLDQNLIRTVDPKTILIIGNKSKEIPESSLDVDTHTKRDTFERFRRNNRNVEIITYDELYERAYYIVHDTKCPI